MNRTLLVLLVVLECVFLAAFVPPLLGATTLRTEPTPTPTQPASSPTPTLAPTDTPLPSPTATPSRTVTPSITATSPATSTATSTVTPSPTATAVPPTPTPVPPTPTATPFRATVAHIGNTNGRGVYLRASPHLDDVVVAWSDDTPLVVLGPEADGDGVHWLQVRDPAGEVGWIPARYVVR